MLRRSTRYRTPISRYDPTVYDLGGVSLLRRVSIKHTNSSSKKNCCICFDTIGKTNVFITDCNHTFCGTCMLTHIRESNLCPLCRTKLTDPIKKVPQLTNDIAEDLIVTNTNIFNPSLLVQLIYNTIVSVVEFKINNQSYYLPKWNHIAPAQRNYLIEYTRNKLIDKDIGLLNLVREWLYNNGDVGHENEVVDALAWDGDVNVNDEGADIQILDDPVINASIADLIDPNVLNVFNNIASDNVGSLPHEPITAPYNSNNNVHGLANNTNLITPNFEGVISSGIVNTTLQQLYFDYIGMDNINNEVNEIVINNLGDEED